MGNEMSARVIKGGVKLTVGNEEFLIEGEARTSLLTMLVESFEEETLLFKAGSYNILIKKSAE